MILPTYYPGKIPQTSPFTPTKKGTFLHKLLVKRPGYLPVVCGWDLRYGKHVNYISHMLHGTGIIFTYEFTRNFGKKCNVNIPFVPYSICTKFTNPNYNTTTFHTLARPQPTPFFSGGSLGDPLPSNRVRV